MTTSEQNKYIQFVNLLNSSNFFVNVNSAVISPLLNCICIISKQKDAALYMLPNGEGCINPFWQCSSKVQRCFFSVDGKNILFILNVNSIQIYSICEDKVSLTVQIKASVLTELLRNYKMDFSSACQVNPLKIKWNELIIAIDKKLILNVEWSLIRKPNIRYSIFLDNYTDLCVNEKFIFVLINNGIINAYNTATGQKWLDDYNAQSLNKSNPDIFVGTNFFKICVHMDSKIMAVVNQDEETILFETNGLLSDEKSVSPLTTETKKEKWIWPYKNRKSNMNPKLNTCKILGKVPSPSGLVVSYLQFSLKGLFAFYCILGQEKCISFKVIDETSGNVLYSFEGLVESKVICGGPMPLVMTDSILSICLGVLNNDYFVLKLCEIVPNFGFSKEFERTLFLQSLDGAFYVHLTFLKIILSLHFNIFHSNVKRLLQKKVEKKESVGTKFSFFEKKMMEKIDELFKTVLEYREDEKSQELNIKQLMLCVSFQHAVRLLDLLHVETMGTLDSDCSTALLKNILILFQNNRQQDPLKDEWVSWLEMTDFEIIREAVVTGAVALAHVFFVTHREWSVDEVESKFKSEAHAWVIELITMNDLEKAKTVLKNLKGKNSRTGVGPSNQRLRFADLTESDAYLVFKNNFTGFDPSLHLKNIFLETSDPLLRDILGNHLLEINELSEEEIEMWNFNKKIEAALSSVIRKYHTFEHKMSVSAKDRVKIIALKLPPYNGSIDIKMVLNCSQEWRDMTLTEVYFNTGDIALEKLLNKKKCWQYLLEKNQIELLKNWIDIVCDPECLDSLNNSSDYLTRSFYNLFSGWWITEDMLALANEVKCMTATRDSVLDKCAYYGLFISSEKNSFKSIVYRLENNSLLPFISSILLKPTANVLLGDFDKMIFNKCIEHFLQPVILICLNDVSSLCNSSAITTEHHWVSVWSLFFDWEKNKMNMNLLKDLIRKSFQISPPNAEELPFLGIAIALIENREISDLIENGDEDFNLLQLPLVAINWQTAQGTSNKQPDVTLYDLLHCSNVPVDKLFLWQTQNKYLAPSSSQELFTEFPHFNHQVLDIKYGFRQNLDYIYYLKQARPSFACNLFIVESLRTQRRLTTKMIKRVCGIAHGLALRYWKNCSIGSASVAFITMLGDIISANTLRIHLAAVECISDYLSTVERNYISTLVRGIVTKEQFYVQEMASLLETSILSSVTEEKSAVQLEKWYLVVSFCNTHGLPLPTLLLRYLAQNHEWFPFVLCLDVFKYPYEQAIELIEEIDSKILKSHLIRALTRTTLKLSTTSPSKSPPKILLEPDNNGKDDVEPTNTKDNKDIFQSFVTNIYTEVLNTIQTFTDKNIVLPWSCEQDPDSDVLLTLLKCESEPDTSKSLLISSIELQSPVLAVLATCFQSDNIFSNLMAWLISSIPTSLTRIKRREEGVQLVDRHYSAKEVETLFIHFFSAGYFQTFYRGITLFMPENPLTLFLRAVYYSVVLLDFTVSLELLKEFVIEMAHIRSKEPVGVFSKPWILKIVAQCIENLLTRTDIQNSTKRHFLRILAESDLAAVDPSFPNYLLWSQICEILESSETNLDFIQLYDIAMVSEELQTCLDSLIKNFQFTQALEICSLLSLNKDKCVIAMWKHHLELSIKTGGNIQKLWTDSSLAFKDENVNPNLAALFYYEAASHFQDFTPDSLKNKYFALEYCLHWRRLIEDTLSASFREESDSIELQKWNCCLEPIFDINILKSVGPIDVSYSLLVSIWSSSKVLVRSKLSEEAKEERVENLINMFLDQGDLQKALRLSAFYKSNNQDLMTITSCLKVTHGEITPSELTKLNAALQDTSKKLFSQGQCELDLSEYEMVPSKEQHEMLSLLEKLCQTVKHGRSLANKILVCYRLSVNLDLTFKDVASERYYLTLLARSVSLEGVNKFSVASDLITLADLPGTDLAKFLKDKIVSAVMECHSNDLVVPVTLWDVSLDSEFHQIINLIDNPSLLGLELLQASVSLPCSAGVEVLIRAHDCFTACCNVEGIGRVLRRARILAFTALQEQQWQYLVRLLVGIERYTDMSYIFQMLKDNKQFEQLLRKGMHKAPGLHVAISEFLQRNCPQDRELNKMVAAHFGLYAKLGILWQEEADEIISKLTVVENILKDSGKTRQNLTLAMDNYSHAVQWFLQAGKLNRALKVAHQAQMVALQISLLGGPFILKIQSRAQLQALANDSLSVAQIMLISRAYDLEPDWIAAFHERWILKGDKSFYSDLTSASILTSRFIQLHALRYDLEQISNAKAKDRIKQLVKNSSQQQSPLLRDLKEE